MTDATEPLVSVKDVRAAAERIAGRVVRTPLIPFAAAEPGRPLWLKPESLQPTGAFKLRGAFNAILQRLDEARSRGVVTHSSGNHARAVAWVARELGLRATIVMPDAAPAVKVDAVRRLGAEVVIVSPEERDTRAFDLAAEHGYVMIPPYDDTAVVAGGVGQYQIAVRPGVNPQAYASQLQTTLGDDYFGFAAAAEPRRCWRSPCLSPCSPC